MHDHRIPGLRALVLKRVLERIFPLITIEGERPIPEPTAQNEACQCIDFAKADILAQQWGPAWHWLMRAVQIVKALANSKHPGPRVTLGDLDVGTRIVYCTHVWELAERHGASVWIARGELRHTLAATTEVKVLGVNFWEIEG